MHEFPWRAGSLYGFILDFGVLCTYVLNASHGIKWTNNLFTRLTPCEGLLHGGLTWGFIQVPSIGSLMEIQSGMPLRAVGFRDLLQSSGPPQAEARNAGEWKCKKYKASTAGHSVRRPIALGHPVAKLYDVALLPLLPSRYTRWL